MTQDLAVEIIRNGVFIILSISLPIVGVGLLVGFMISLFQAVTQIQEQTLTFVPKMIVVLLMLVFTFPYITSMLIGFVTTLWGTIPSMTR